MAVKLTRTQMDKLTWTLSFWVTDVLGHPEPSKAQLETQAWRMFHALASPPPEREQAIEKAARGAVEAAGGTWDELGDEDRKDAFKFAKGAVDALFGPPPRGET